MGWEIFGKPEFYDVFGLGVFLFLFFVGLFGMKGKKFGSWVYVVLLVIGILGILVDGLIVYFKFVR